MSQRTDAPEFARGFLWQVSLLTVVVLAFLSFEQTLFFRKLPFAGTPTPSPVTIIPWMSAGRHTLELGLKAFAGKSATEPNLTDKAGTLMSLLLGMVIWPTAALIGWRRRRLSRPDFPRRAPLESTAVMYALGWVITTVFVVPLVPMVVTSEGVRSSLRSAQAVQDNRNEIINELNMLAVEAAQYYLVPKHLGGGGRSFEGLTLPAEHMKTRHANYTIVVQARETQFHAESVLYPRSTVDVKADSLGRTAWWKYSGRFE